MRSARVLLLVVIGSGALAMHAAAVPALGNRLHYGSGWARRVP